jgi:hypothetical protein
MSGRVTRKLTDALHRLERSVTGTADGDGVFRTPAAEEWAEMSLSRRQLDSALDRDSVHRRHGEP